MQPELQGERELWLPSAVNKMFGEHALLSSEVSQPTRGGQAAPLQMGVGGSATPEWGQDPSHLPRPSSCPRLTSCFSSRLGAWMPAQGMGHTIPSREPPAGSGEPTPPQ